MRPVRRGKVAIAPPEGVSRVEILGEVPLGFVEAPGGLEVGGDGDGFVGIADADGAGAAARGDREGVVADDGVCIGKLEEGGRVYARGVSTNITAVSPGRYVTGAYTVVVRVFPWRM